MPAPTAQDVPRVNVKTTPPAGVVPKDLQRKVMAALVAAMVAVIIFSSWTTPTKRTTPAVTAGSVPASNAESVQSFTKQLDAEMDAMRRTAPAQADSMPKQAEAAAGPAVAGERQNQSERKDSTANIRPKRVRRDDAPASRDIDNPVDPSLFSSNVALTFRHPPAPAAAAVAAAIPASPPPAAGAAGQVSETKPAAKPTFTLFEGTIIPTVLTNRLDGSIAGPVNCMVSTDVYTADGKHLLIPQGSRVLGSVAKVDSLGQQRLSVTFHRLIMPNGNSITLEHLPGLSQAGETGLHDEVNHHYFQLFGTSIALGAIAGLGELNIQSSNPSGTNLYEQGTAASLSQSSMRILDRFLNVMPTLVIREGQTVNVYLSSDLFLPAYEVKP